MTVKKNVVSTRATAAVEVVPEVGRKDWRHNPVFLIGVINALLIVLFGVYLTYRSHALDASAVERHEVLEKRLKMLERSVWTVRRTQVGAGIDVFDRLDGSMRQP